MNTQVPSHVTDINHLIWRCGDKTDLDLSLFDWMNIARCAQRRAMSHAGICSESFGREYHATRALTKKAARY